MIDYSVRIIRHPVIQVPALTAEQMFEVGQRADELIESRVDSPSPRDVSQSPAPKLSSRHLRRKLKQGLRGVRDLRFTGELYSEMGVYRARKGYVYVGFKTTFNYMKALKQQKKFQWFGLADEEESAVVERARDLFGDNCKQFGEIGAT